MNKLMFNDTPAQKLFTQTKQQTSSLQGRKDLMMSCYMFPPAVYTDQAINQLITRQEGLDNVLLNISPAVYSILKVKFMF